jgi:hypothetical protein
MEGPAKFKKNCINLTHTFEAIVADCCEKGMSFVDPGMVAFVRGFLSRMDEVELMETFLERSHNNWPQISVRDETFFLTNANTIFGDFSKNNVLCFKQLFETPDAITLEDRELMWDFFDAFILTCYKTMKETLEGGSSVLNANLVRNILSKKECVNAISIISSRKKK